MPKKKDKNGEEFWRGKCRELEKRVRQLEKIVAYHEKREHNFERSQDEEVFLDNEDTPSAILISDCSQCGKGKMKETLNILNKIYGECSHCGHRGRMK